MEKQQKKQVKKYISWVLIVALVALLAFLPVIAAQEEAASGPQASILTAQAEIRDISTVILGGGSLVTQDAVEITVPSAVKLTEYLVENGEMVAEGQSIAKVDRVSVMSAISQIQETLAELKDQLKDVSSDTDADEINATAGGTVKVIYAGEGESVRDVMLRDGALAVISLDGMMAVQVERNTNLSGGEQVCVILSDGTEVAGKVESNLEGILTVTVEDQGYALEEEVTVTTVDGDRIGTGRLYIHSRWNVVGYSGTISRIRVKEGESVRAGRTLFTLENAGHTAEFETLARKHREYEDLMLELFQMYQSETVTAPRDGMITGVDETGAYMLSDFGAGWELSLLANSPIGDDETTYLNFVGQVAEVGIDGLILNMNPQPLMIEDYKDLSTVPLDPALMTESAIYAASAPVYELAAGEWVQLDAAAIAPGDILLFTGDSAGNFVWVVRVARGTTAPEDPQPSQPTEPADPSQPTEPGTQPDTPTDPSQPSGGNLPSGGNFPSGGMGQMGGSMPSFGGTTQEEDDSLYSLETVTIASVIPQESVTVTVTVDETDIAKVYLGQEAAVMVEALQGRQFTGTVTAISANGENEGGNSKFTLEVTLDKTADMLYGMTASVTIIVATREGVIAVPVAALVETGTQTLVYTGYDEETETLTGAAPVTTGVSDGEYVQILSGIQPGQQVCYPYYDTLVISDAPEMGGGFFMGR